MDRSVLNENNKKRPAFDLIKESDSLAVVKEQTIQKLEPSSRHVYSFTVGDLTAQSVTLTANGYTTNYDMKNEAAIYTAKMGYYPVRWYGYWGLLSAVGYSEREQMSEPVPSALHLFAADILLSYRLEPSSTSWAKTLRRSWSRRERCRSTRHRSSEYVRSSRGGRARRRHRIEC